MATASSSGLSSALAGGNDTIVARATPPGAGALAVIRISGPDTRRVLHGLAPGWRELEPWRARLVRISVEGVEDEAVGIFYRAPRSYTGEDMAELMLHGSRWLVEACLQRLVEAGARRARPGELTRRAVANGKLTLAQAEGVRDLVAAETRWEARVARARLEGRLSRRLEALHGRLVQLLAEVEGAVDFAAQGVDLDPGRVGPALQRLEEEIEGLARTARSASYRRGGVRVVIAGPPNAGKSTLFNALLARERAIVSPHPGTTRDTLEARLEMAGRPVVLVDTAGLRPAGDPVEAEGVRRTREALAEADVVVRLHGADQGSPEDPAGAGGTPALRVLSRTDLAPGVQREGWLGVNLRAVEGVASVRSALERLLVERLPEEAGEGLLSPRQAELAEAAAAELERAPRDEPELLAEALRWAAARLEEMIGRIADEEVLDRVFATFCLGK